MDTSAFLIFGDHLLGIFPAPQWLRAREPDREVAGEAGFVVHFSQLSVEFLVDLLQR